MLKTNIVAVGKVKEKYFQLGIEEYIKRTSRFADIKILELKEENFNNPSDSEKEIIKNKESNSIIKQMKGYCIALAIEGKKISSEKLAKTITDLSSSGISEITFIIGGSYGLADIIKNKADMLLSVSDMTFPHTMFRLILSEQIYRAFTIINNVGYHK